MTLHFLPSVLSSYLVYYSHHEKLHVSTRAKDKIMSKTVIRSKMRGYAKLYPIINAVWHCAMESRVDTFHCLKNSLIFFTYVNKRLTANKGFNSISARIFSSFFVTSVAASCYYFTFFTVLCHYVDFWPLEFTFANCKLCDKISSFTYAKSYLLARVGHHYKHSILLHYMLDQKGFITLVSNSLSEELTFLFCNLLFKNLKTFDSTDLVLAQL